MSSPDRLRIAVCIGTYRRNEPLAVLLQSVRVAAERVTGRAAVGVVVVDDNADGRARAVVDGATDMFELGIHYRQVGEGNISKVRNAGLTAGLEFADFIALTDDDCEVTPEWLDAMLAVQAATGADTVTGPCISRVPAGSPAWLTEQPFLTVGSMSRPDGDEIDVAATNNSLISARWLRDHPDLRFADELGVLGGEDVVFFRSAHALGMHIRYSAKGIVYANEPAARATFRYHLCLNYWLGNTICVTHLHLGVAGRPRLLAHGVAILADGLTRPMRRIVRGRPPQLRYAAALVARFWGVVLGVMGVRRAHH